MPDGTAIDILLEDAVAIHEPKRFEYKCHIPATTSANAITLVYNYHYKEWYLWKGLDMSGGIAVLDDDLYFQTKNASQDINKRSSTKSDGGEKIEAFYKSCWHNMGEAGVNKKFAKGTLYSLEDDDFTVTVKTQNNWIDEDETEGTIDIEDGKRFGQFGIDKNVAKAMRIIFENSDNNKEMNLTSYELRVEGNYRVSR
jgi:hypothetical protein